MLLSGIESRDLWGGSEIRLPPKRLRWKLFIPSTFSISLPFLYHDGHVPLRYIRLSGIAKIIHLKRLLIDSKFDEERKETLKQQRTDKYFEVQLQTL